MNEQLLFLGLVLTASQWTVVAAFLQFVAAAVMAGATIWLVRVTRRYAQSTAEIAGSTEEQAKASRQMAEEMAKARFASARPIIVFDAHSLVVTKPTLTQDAILVPLSFETSFRNEGTGPALNIQCSIDTCGYTYGSPSAHILLGTDLAEIVHGRLPRRGRVKVELLRTDRRDVEAILNELRGVIQADYRDVYGNPYRSTMDFHYGPGTPAIVLANLQLYDLAKEGNSS